MASEQELTDSVAHENRLFGLSDSIFVASATKLSYNNRTMIQSVATHIELRENRDGQKRAFVEGTRIRIQDIYAQAELFGKTAEQIAENFPDLTLGKVHAALSYLFDHREQILAELKEDEAFVEHLKSGTGPSILSQRLNRATGT